MVAMNSLSVNFHLLLTSFIGPAQRHKILIEANAASTLCPAQLQLRGYDSATSLIELAPRGAELPAWRDVLATLEQQGQNVPTMLLPGVQCLTGQVFDMAAIRKSRNSRAVVGFDLAHAIGNAPAA
jgi:kynureninase